MQKINKLNDTLLALVTTMFILSAAGMIIAFIGIIILALTPLSHAETLDTHAETLEMQSSLESYNPPFENFMSNYNLKVFAGNGYSKHFHDNNLNEKHKTLGLEIKSINTGWAVGGIHFVNSYSKDANSIYTNYSWNPKTCEFEYLTCSIGAGAGIASGYEDFKINLNGYIPRIYGFVDITAFNSAGVRLSVENWTVATATFYLEF